MGSIIDTAISGLKLSQTALSITGQNIVNANTEGYSRQTVTAEATTPIFNGVGYIGTGVAVSQITRNTAQFLIDQVSTDLSVLGEYDQFLTNISQMDNLLADPATSVAASMGDFFEALNGVANNPTGLESRQLLLSQSHLLLTRFQSAESAIINQNEGLNKQLDSFASSITTLAKEISELNNAISSSPGVINGILPNDLLDRRDTLVRDLSELVNVKTTLQPNMSMNVFIGYGQGLVIGTRASEIATVPGRFDPARRQIAFVVNGKPQIVTDQLRGGELGGIVRFRKEALDPALNSLGRIALALTDAVNQQQMLGVDLEGNLGNRVFTDINDPALVAGRVEADSGNAPPTDRRLSVTIDDISQVGTSDYRIDFPGPGTRFSIYRLQDNTLLEQGILGAKLPQEISIDGITIRFDSGSFQQGDAFVVRPTRRGIGNIDVAISRPEAFALAAPLTAESGAGNQGGAFVSSVEASDVTTSSFTSMPGQLSPPVQIRFTSPSHYDVLDYSDPANPVSMQPPLNNQTFVPGGINAVYPNVAGGTTVSSSLVSAGRVQLSQSVNGYIEETITITQIDPVTGFATINKINTETDQGVNSLAQRLTAINGVHATAMSQLQLSLFTSDGADTPLGVSLNGVSLTSAAMIGERTLPDPPNADFLRDSINLSQALKDLGISASSDGVVLTVRSNTGVDLSVDITGNGSDSLQLRGGDLRTIVGEKNVGVGYTAPLNSSFELDAGFGPSTVTLTPGTIGHQLVVSVLQADIDRAMGKDVVNVSRGELGNILFVAVDRSRVLTVSNVSGDDPLGIAPITMVGPNLGEQAAQFSGGASTVNPYDFSSTNAAFTLTINGIYTDVITLDQNYPSNGGASIVAAINGQITTSTGPNGLAGQVVASLDASGALRFESTAIGPGATVALGSATNSQGIVVNGSAVGSQLIGSQASVSGVTSVLNGVNFDTGGPHSFTIAVDGNPPVVVNLTGSTGNPAIFTNTVDVSAGVDLSAAPNGFDLIVAGQPLVTVDLSGIDTTLAASPTSSAPPGIVTLIQTQIDAQLGANVVTVAIDGSNKLTLSTVDKGVGTSLTVANPTGDVATELFPVVGTAVGSDLGASGALSLISNAINQSLSIAGLGPVQVDLEGSGVLTIRSSAFGDTSQVSISGVIGALGIIFPGTDHGVDFTSSATVGGILDVQLAPDTKLTSNRRDGLFGKTPEAIDNYTGYQIFLNSGGSGSGVPVAGDTFLIEFNRAGSMDNTNALAMVAINSQKLLSNGNLTLLAAYSQVVEDVGVQTSDARVSQEASESLLRQSEASLQSIAGVNIDEEAANLIKFEQHYNASAQLIAIARELFNTLLEF